jgi:hypothetical protein
MALLTLISVPGTAWGAEAAATAWGGRGRMCNVWTSPELPAGQPVL